MIFPSTLIVSENLDSASIEIEKIFNSLGHKLNTNNPDLFFVNESTGWNIDHIRTIKTFLSKKPFNHESKIVIIENTENLNIESQNAILKTLEEPGENNYLILITSKTQSLLQTIISRCNIIKIKSKKREISLKPLIITKNIARDLAESEKLSEDKTKVLSYLEDQLQIFQKELIKNSSSETADLIKKIIKAISMIRANVDPKSTLDYVFLT